MQPIKDFDFSTVPQHAICAAATEYPPYEGERILYLEHWPQYNDHTIVNGGHCSCYGMDEVKFDATTYTADELAALMRAWQENGTSLERKIARPVLTIQGD